MFSAKYGLNETIKRIQPTGEVPQRTRSHLATIVSRALQPQDGRIHIDFFFIFGKCGDNCKLDLFLRRKLGVTGLPRSLNPSKAIAMAICAIIVHFST